MSDANRDTETNFEPCYCEKCDGKLPAPCRYGTGTRSSNGRVRDERLAQLLLLEQEILTQYVSPDHAADERDRIALFMELQQRRSSETNAGIPCIHCHADGEEQQVYDPETGWSDPGPCETCGGTGRIRTVEQYLKTLPADWHKDSSLETWFPITAQHYDRICEGDAECPGCQVELVAHSEWCATNQSKPAKKTKAASTLYWHCGCGCNNYYISDRLVCPVSGDNRPAEKTGEDQLGHSCRDGWVIGEMANCKLCTPENGEGSQT